VQNTLWQVIKICAVKNITIQTCTVTKSQTEHDYYFDSLKPEWCQHISNYRDYY